MIILLMVISIIFACVQEFVKKSYLLRHKNQNDMLYNCFMVIGAISVFVITGGWKFTFHLPTFYYALIYSVCYALALIFMMKALTVGNMALSVIIISFSLVIPLGVGLFVFNEPVNIFGKIGVLLLFLTIILIGKTDSDVGDKDKISIKWVVYITIATVANGIAGALVKFHRMQFPDAYSSELMIMSLFMVLIICTFLTFFNANKNKISANGKVRRINRTIIVPTLIYGVMTGACNGIANWLSIKLIEMMPLVQKTVIEKCGIFILTYLVSMYYYKEYVSKYQKMGVITGIVSVIMLSI